MSHSPEPVINSTVARGCRRPEAEETANLPAKLPPARRGGFVRDGYDGWNHHMLQTREGLNALRIFARLGSFSPLYLTQAYFDHQQG